MASSVEMSKLLHFSSTKSIGTVRPFGRSCQQPSSSYSARLLGSSETRISLRRQCGRSESCVKVYLPRQADVGRNSRSLRSACNVLIAIGAFTDVFHQSGHFVYAYSIFTGHNFMPLGTCFWWQCFPVFMMNFGGFITLSIGVDRLVSVLLPTRQV